MPVHTGISRSSARRRARLRGSARPPPDRSPPRRRARRRRTSRRGARDPRGQDGVGVRDHRRIVAAAAPTRRSSLPRAPSVHRAVRRHAPRAPRGATGRRGPPPRRRSRSSGLEPRAVVGNRRAERGSRPARRRRSGWHARRDGTAAAARRRSAPPPRRGRAAPVDPESPPRVLGVGREGRRAPPQARGARRGATGVGASRPRAAAACWSSWIVAAFFRLRCGAQRVGDAREILDGAVVEVGRDPPPLVRGTSRPRARDPRVRPACAAAAAEPPREPRTWTSQRGGAGCRATARRNSIQMRTPSRRDRASALVALEDAR